MTLEELMQKCQKNADLGLENIVLVKRFKSRPKGQRVRVLPGVMGRVVGEVRAGEYLVDCKLVELMRVLESLTSTAAP